MSPTSARPGFFITLEGGEGAGKSTFARILAADLGSTHPDVLVTREPGEGRIGRAIRNIVLDSDNVDLDPRVEALLFAADRAQHVAEMIQPAIDRGAVVICDRYIDSSVAYQGYARGLGAENISYLSMWGTENLIPDLTILIDIDPSIGISRKFEQDEVNRMEQLDISFHETVRDAFLTIAEHNTDRVVVIDGSRPIEQVYADILHTVTERWNSR